MLIAHVGILSVSCINGVLELFRFRDNKVLGAHTAVYEGHDDVPSYKASVFLNDEFNPMLLSESIDLSTYFDMVDGFTIQQYHRVYCLHKIDDIRSIAFLDFVDETLYVITPSLNAEELTVDSRTLLDSVMDKFNSLAGPLNFNFTNWSIKLYPYTYIEPVEMQECEGNGIYTLAVLYFLVMDVPIYLTPSIIETFRSKFCYWILNASLPV